MQGIWITALLWKIRFYIGIIADLKSVYGGDIFAVFWANIQLAFFKFFQYSGGSLWTAYLLKQTGGIIWTATLETRPVFIYAAEKQFAVCLLKSL